MLPSMHEDLYISQPKGHEVKGKEHFIWKLQKALYGTKQAAYEWQQMLTKILMDLGCVPIRGDAATFILEDKDTGGWVIMPTHVDDLLPLYNEPGRVLRDKIFEGISKHVKISNSGSIHWALQTLIERDKENGVLKISQGSFVRAVLERFPNPDRRENLTPGFENQNELSLDDLPVTEEDKAKVAAYPFQEIIGCLWWLVTVSRPDIAVATYKAAQWGSRGSLRLIKHLEHLLGYLKKYPDDGLVYTQRQGNEFNGPRSARSDLEFAADSSFADVGTDMKSTLGNLELLLGNLIGYSSGKSSRTPGSSCEAEIMALVKAFKINSFLRLILSQFPKEAVNVEGPTITREDNESAVKLLRFGGKQKQSRHFGLDFHILKEHVLLNEMSILQVPGLENPADFFTKLLGRTLLDKYKVELMGNREFQEHFAKCSRLVTWCPIRASHAALTSLCNHRLASVAHKASSRVYFNTSKEGASKSVTANVYASSEGLATFKSYFMDCSHAALHNFARQAKPKVIISLIAPFGYGHTISQ